MTSDIQKLDEQVLSTLNRDGSRLWLRPKASPGRFLALRRTLGYALIALFVLLPHLRLNGKPPLLLDLPNREFTFFGTTFLPTDTLLLALLFLTIFVSIFLLTALFGRVWCGWACPQTVYMEMVYRPIERLFDGKSYRNGGKTPVHPLRRIGKYAVFLVISFLLANTFLAYFVGADTLKQWMVRSPLEHPIPFMVVAFVTGLMMFDFCVFREQVCTLMCPYGRFQSVMLDRQSLIVAYDEKRGEPRGKLKSREERGDCIDCRLCVTTCPTGIDIRKGLQMECIHCAQCIDACDGVMERVGRQRGLIRYSSQEAMATGKARLLRPRVVLYPLALAVLVTLFLVTLARRTDVDVSFLRNQAATHSVLPNGDVASSIVIKLTNLGEEARQCDIEVLDEGVTMDCPGLPLKMGPRESASAVLQLVVPRGRFEGGRAAMTIRVTDNENFDRTYNRYVLGPLFGGVAVPADVPEAADEGEAGESETETSP